MHFKQLITSLSKINTRLLEQSLRAINISLTLRNWFFGYHIVAFEQNGNDRAEYGKGLLASIAKEMKDLHIPNSDEREIRRYRQFYTAYPGAANFLASDDEIRGLLPPGTIENHMEISANQIRGLPTPESMDNNIEIIANQIRGLPTPEFKVPDIHYVNLFKRISYTHFKELIRIEDPLKRLFYELECIKGTWSVKELKKQIGSILYERTGLSKNKEKLLALTHQDASTQTFADIIRDPYFFGFLHVTNRAVPYAK